MSNDVSADNPNRFRAAIQDSNLYAYENSATGAGVGNKRRTDTLVHCDLRKTSDALVSHLRCEPLAFPRSCKECNF